MTRDQLKSAVRSATRESEFTAWRLANNMPEHSGAMTKAQWVVAYDHFVAGTDPVASPAPAPAPEKDAQTMTATPNKTAAAPDPFKDAENFLAKPVLDPLRAAYDAAMRDATAAKSRAAKLERDLAAAKSAPAPVAAPVAGPVASPAPAPVRVKPSAPVCNFVTETNLADLTGGRVSETVKSRNIMLPVGDYDLNAADPNYIPPAHTPDILTAASLGLSVALYGSKGTGKSSFWRWVAAISKRPHIEIAFHGETSHADLFGFEGPSPDGGTEWIEGDLLTAVKTPMAIVDCAEIAKSRPDMVTALNSVFESGQRAIFAGGQWHHFAPGVWLVATSNDPGTGEMAGQYHGVKPMDESLRSRLIWFELELPNKTQLSRMVTKVTGLSKDAADILAEFETQMQRNVSQGACESTPGFRALSAWGKLVRAGVDARTAFNAAALNSATPEDRTVWADAAAADFDYDKFEALARGETPVETRDGFTAVA